MTYELTFTKRDGTRQIKYHVSAESARHLSRILQGVFTKMAHILGGNPQVEILPIKTWYNKWAE
jgi:hypothetical protein